MDIRNTYVILKIRQVNIKH